MHLKAKYNFMQANIWIAFCSLKQKLLYPLKIRLKAVCFKEIYEALNFLGVNALTFNEHSILSYQILCCGLI